MRIAAIDLGSNTFHLIIADIASNKQLKIVFKINKPVKLSEDLTITNSIIPEAFERGVKCLLEYKEILDKYNVKHVRAVATSAVRSANNGENFVKVIRDLAGLEIEVFSGEQEAALIYAGVKESGGIQGKTLVMDIGGGSTEFIFCDENKVFWKKSFDIGAARLMQRFWSQDPISQKEIKAIDAYLNQTLNELIEFNKGFNAQILLGSAGAFETFKQMIDPFVPLEDCGFLDIDMDQYKSLSKKLSSATHQERAAMPYLIPLRVDMIVMASIQTDFVLENLSIPTMRMTLFDLKYGLLSTLKNERDADY